MQECITVYAGGRGWTLATCSWEEVKSLYCRFRRFSPAKTMSIPGTALYLCAKHCIDVTNIFNFDSGRPSPLGSGKLVTSFRQQPRESNKSKTETYMDKNDDEFCDPRIPCGRRMAAGSAIRYGSSSTWRATLRDRST